MPWEHCGQQVLDTQRCPACGISKESWTLEWNVTRTFQVQAGKRAALKLILQDADGRPIPNAAYTVELPDGSTLQGTLDATGSARIDPKQQGACVVRFPGLPPEAWQRRASP